MNWRELVCKLGRRERRQANCDRSWSIMVQLPGLDISIAWWQLWHFSYGLLPGATSSLYRFDMGGDYKLLHLRLSMAREEIKLSASLGLHDTICIAGPYLCACGIIIIPVYMTYDTFCTIEFCLWISLLQYFLHTILLIQNPYIVIFLSNSWTMTLFIYTIIPSLISYKSCIV